MNKVFVYRLNKFLNKDNTINIYCIGSNKIVGDMIGPMVGSMLIGKLESDSVKILGNLSEPLTYKKLLNGKIDNKNNIFIDSALGHKTDIGKVIINDTNMVPGRALNRKYNWLEGTSIKAIVGENKNSSILNIIELKRISYDYVHDFARYISNNIYETVKNIE